MASATKEELEERNAELETALEEIRDRIDTLLGEDDEDDGSDE